MRFLFQDWSGIGRTLLVGPLAYVALILFLRFSGKRTLAKMNAFDWVVTVALGSTLATVLLSESVALAEGAVALALLVATQFVVAWLSVRAGVVRRMVRSQPTVLLRRGAFRSQALRRERVTENEIRQAVRQQGIRALEDVDAVVLETDGTFSVLRRGDGSSSSALAGVTGWADGTSSDR